MSSTDLPWRTAAAALACLAPAPVAASSLRALGGASAGAHSVTGLEQRLLTPGPGSLQITLGATANDTAYAEPPPTNFEIQALVDGIGVARYGSLAGRAHAEARSAPAGPYLAGGQVSVIPGFTDGAEVRSDTLATGTPVTLSFRMTLAATAIHFVDGLDPQGTGAAVRYEIALSDLDNLAQLPAEGALVINSRGFEETSRVLELDTAIGHHVELVADLAVNAGVRVDHPFLGVSQGTADALAEQTGELFYEPSGDVRLVTDSGHDYAVPEPGQGWLTLAAGLALWCRRRRPGPSRGSLCRGAAALALACLASSVAAAGALRATGFANALAHRVDGQPSELLTPGPGSLTITVGASASDALENNQPPPELWEMEGLADAIGVARYGLLAGAAHAEASSLPTNVFDLTRGEAQVHPGYTDGAQVVSDTLTPDTPVTLTFRMTLDATATHFVDGPFLYPPSFAVASHEVVVRDLDAPAEARGFLVVDSVSHNETTRTFQLDTAIGHRIEILADLNVGAQMVIDNRGAFAYSEGILDVFATQTAELFFEPSGDLRLETDSGHEYAAPEPGRATLLALSAALVLLRGRHRRGAGAVAR